MNRSSLWPSSYRHATQDLERFLISGDGLLPLSLLAAYAILRSMVHHLGDEDPPRIDDALNPVRAAIDMVANGAATRITVHTTVGDQILPAARLLARAAGVTLEPTWRVEDAGWDLVVTR